MSEVPPSQGQPDDVDDTYRRASALDPSRPSEWVRRAVLTHATQLATGHATDGPTSINSTRPIRHQAWWRPAAFGTLAAAALAGLLIVPHVLSPPAPSRAALPPAAVSQPQAAASQAIRAPASDTKADQPSPSSPLPTQSTPPAEITVTVQAERRTQADVPLAAAAMPTDSIGSMAQRAPSPDPHAALRRAAENGDIAGLQTSLDQQVDIDSRDADGRTALMLATLHGQTNAVELLLAHGADPSAADAHGTTPLKAAVAGEQTAIIEALKRAGAQ